MSVLIAVHGCQPGSSGGFWRRWHPGGHHGYMQARAQADWRPQVEGTSGARVNRNTSGPTPPCPVRKGQHGGGRAAWDHLEHRCLGETRFLKVLPKRDGRGGCAGTRVSEMEGVVSRPGEQALASSGAGQGTGVPLGNLQCSRSGGGWAHPLSTRGCGLFLVRRTRMSVPCAGTAGSSSAVTAAPEPSTWPACPRRSRRSPGEPGMLVTSAAPVHPPPGFTAISTHCP